MAYRPTQSNRPGGFGGTGGAGGFGGGSGGRGGGAAFGLGGPIPRDLLILIGVLFGTFVLSSFASTALAPAMLRLTPEVWRSGMIWQLVTYPFVGAGDSFFFLIELLILFIFGRDVFITLGRKRFWRLVLYASVAAAVAAVLIQLLVSTLASGSLLAAPFGMMQGQRMLLTIAIAAFATLYGEATILLFFVLPIKARWFLPLEILFAFVAFLSNKDFAGFIGIVTAVAVSWSLLSSAGPQRLLREWWLRAQKKRMEWELAQAKRKRKMTVHQGGKANGKPDDDDDNVRKGPWIN